MKKEAKAEAPRLHPLAGKSLVVGVNLLVFAAILAFMLMEGGAIILIELMLLSAAVLIFRKRPEQLSMIKEQFNRYRLLAVITPAILMLAIPFAMAGNTYWLYNLVFAGVYIIASLGLNLQLGSTGIVNLSGAAFYGVGAYTAALLSKEMGVPTELTLLLGALMAGVFSIFLFIPLLRTTGHYVALVTIAFQFIFVILAENLEFTGGPQGISNIPLLSIFGYEFGQTYQVFGIQLPAFTDFYFIVVAFLLIAVLISHRLYHSWVGITLSTIRDDEIVAKSFGVNVDRWKMIIFTLGNGFMGFAGAFYAHLIGNISPYIFAFDRSLVMVSIVILGGMDNIAGVILGGFLLILLPEKLRFIGDYRLLFYGLALIAGLLFRPRGLLPYRVRDFVSLARKGKKAYMEKEAHATAERGGAIS